MIVDMHTHVFPDKIAASVLDKLSRMSRSMPFTDGTISGLIDSMSAAKVDRAIILPVATNTDQVKKINDVAAKINEVHGDAGIISFGCIHPDCTDCVEELTRIKSLGIVGIKIHPIYQGVDIDDPKYLRIFNRAAELGLIVVTHAGLDIGFPGVVRCSPQMIRKVVDKIGDFKLILAHMGGWRNWDEVIDVLADTKVWIDTAFSTGMITPRPDAKWNRNDLTMLNADQFMKFVKAFTADRIVFGTDSPWSSQAESIKFINQLSMSEVDRRKILGGNAIKLIIQSIAQTDE